MSALFPRALLLLAFSGCGYDWKAVDDDGDGFTAAEGDCWDAADGSPGGGLSGDAIFPGAPDTPYDGIDADCAGNDDYDLDGDGYVPEGVEPGAETAGVAAPEHLGAGDCWDNPTAIPDEFSALNGFPQMASREVFPGAGNTFYDGIDQGCAGADDFDVDQDGYDSALYPQRDGTAGDDCLDNADEAYEYNGGNLSPEAINPGAAELCDDSDNDCNTLVDELDPEVDLTSASLLYRDGDEDGYGDAAEQTTSCGSKEGYVDDDTDCDDAQPGAYPGASEYCDGYDNDCAGDIDETDALDVQGWYPDADGDTQGNPDGLQTQCYAPDSTYVLDSNDCDDSAADTYLGAALEALSSCMKNSDGDDYGDDNPPSGVIIGSDCDDDDAAIHPDAAEGVGDEVDQDCDNGEICYLDNDNDTYRPDATSTKDSASDTDCADSGEALATQPTTDCDDGDAAINPVATEGTGDQVDQDCDGAEMCYLDNDDDGYRPDASSTKFSSADADCTDSGEATNAEPTTDCNDSNAAIYPTATELAGDEVDQDCSNTETCYLDADDDGYRPDATSTQLSSDTDCDDADEALSTEPTTDCDDADATINPVATEGKGDQVDQDCDGAEVCYLDNDNDGYRPDTTSTKSSADTDCTDSGEALSTEPTTDCNDGNAAIYPTATELAGDEVDQDCSNTETCYLDADDDGYRPDATSTQLSSDTDCDDADEALSTEPTTDCNDSNAAINPAASEITGDAVDQDCTNTEVCYLDNDDDGYRPDSTSIKASTADTDCSDAGEALSSEPTTDCNDSNAAINPAASEITGDGVDQDCTNTEVCYLDNDDDGYRPNATSTKTSSDTDCSDAGEALSSEPTTDCNDSNSAIKPGVSEITGDAVDQNCDSQETCYLDNDDDGYRPDSTSTKASTADADCSDAGEALSTEPTTDCNDSSGSINPGATEATGDGVDQDCTGTETCYANADGDSYRLTTTVVSTDSDCSDAGEALSTVTSGDCNDGNSAINPGATEITGDGVDQDCTNTEVCYLDNDDDGYRPNATSTKTSTADTDCSDSGEALSTDPTTDCNDSNAAAYPGAAEIVADGIDESCDNAETCYADADGDSFRTSSTVASIDSDCSDAGEALSSMTSGDCDDGDADVNPGEAEICGNTLDDDCDSNATECDLGASESLADAALKWTGEGVNDYAGTAVSARGDVNGDGFKDAVISAYGEGAAYVDYGPFYAGSDVLLSSTIKLDGFNSAADDWALAANGDADDDGADDVLIGVAELASGSGGAFLVYGGSGLAGLTLSTGADAQITHSSATAALGSAVVFVGDQDGDDAADLLIGAQEGSGTGAAYLLFGSPAGALTLPADADVVLSGEAAGDKAGANAGWAGDVNGDGDTDFLVGAYSLDSPSTNCGAAYLLLGPVTTNMALASADAKLVGSTNDSLGWAVAGGGDDNDDGYDDFLVGAIQNTSNPGKAYLFRGAASPSYASTAAATATFTGETNADWFGYSLALAGDFDGDGNADAAIGAPLNDDAGSNAGTVYLYFGPSSGTIATTSADVLIPAESANDRPGTSVSAGDLSGDGVDDLLIGAWKEGGSDTTGAAYLVLGSGL